MNVSQYSHDITISTSYYFWFCRLIVVVLEFVGLVKLVVRPYPPLTLRTYGWLVGRVFASHSQTVKSKISPPHLTCHMISDCHIDWLVFLARFLLRKRRGYKNNSFLSGGCQIL